MLLNCYIILCKEYYLIFIYGFSINNSRRIVPQYSHKLVSHDYGIIKQSKRERDEKL